MAALTSVWRLQDLPIGVRLRLVFACVLLLMITGGAVVLWQFHAIRQRVGEVSVAEQRATTVMSVNNSVVMMMSRLHRTAEQGNRQQFGIEAARLLTTFRSENSETAAVLRGLSPETGRQKLVIDSFTDMLDSLPARIESLIDLARDGDWEALHARLTDQVDHTNDVGEQLMQETGADLSQARNRLFEDMELAERRAAQILVISSLLSLIVAGVLGVMVTRSISRPLSALDGGALAVAQGDFGHQVSVSGNDEFAHLANAFNHMTRELAGQYAHESEARKTAEYLNQTLRRANDDLQVFAYCASHDLQEPLRSINLYSQMLQRKCNGQLDAEAKEFLDYLMEGAGRMSELLKDLLAYIEISSVENRVVDRTSPAAAIDVALANLRTAVETNKATVTCGDLPVVAIKPIHLQQLFQNLIGNAIKYRSDEPPAVRISASRQDRYWQFSVRDNGIGIDPRYHTQIFRIFQRLHCRTKYPGTGIGLAICEKIIERYGGQIWIQSSPGKGSDFQFTLPID